MKHTTNEPNQSRSAYSHINNGVARELGQRIHEGIINQEGLPAFRHQEYLIASNKPAYQ